MTVEEAREIVRQPVTVLEWVLAVPLALLLAVHDRGRAIRDAFERGADRGAEARERVAMWWARPNVSANSLCRCGHVAAKHRSDDGLCNSVELGGPAPIGRVAVCRLMSPCPCWFFRPIGRRATSALPG